MYQPLSAAEVLAAIAQILLTPQRDTTKVLLIRALVNRNHDA